MSFIKNRTPDEQATALAGYLPNDPLWEDKNVNNSGLRKILLGLAAQWLDLRATTNEIVEEYDIRKTSLLLEEWERVVGIPDGCLTINSVTIEQRRLNILLKLAGINATTATQFENIAAVLGYTIDVEAGGESPVYVFPFTFPFILGGASSDTPFVIIVNITDPISASGFPFTFPFTLGTGITSILRCLFNKLKPAHTVVYFNNS